MKAITKAIVEVMKAVKGMEKNAVVGKEGYQYKGTNDRDVKEVFNTALANNGLCIIPTQIDDSVKIERWQEKGRTKQSTMTVVKTKYLLLHESGESVELAGYGHGIDTADKGAGKATTYALKNCLLYTFLTPVGKIDDSDKTHSQEIETPPAKPKATDKAIDKMLAKIEAGEPNILQKAQEAFNLTQAQINDLMDAELAHETQTK